MSEWDMSQADWGYGAGVPVPETRTPMNFLDSFAYTQGGAGGSGELRRWLESLQAKGFTEADFINGLEKYNLDQGYGYTRPTAVYDNYAYNGNGTTGWWGEQARIKAIGQGLDALGKPTGWQSAFNPATEQAQQQGVANVYHSYADRDPDAEDLGDLLKFAGAAGGLYGLGGLLGGAGAAGSSLPSSMLDPAAWGGFDAAVGGGMAESAGAAAGAAGGIGSTGVEGALAAGGESLGGGNMGDWDFMDLLDGGDSALPGGTNPYGGDLGLPNGTLPDGSVDVGASWQNQLQAALSGMPNMPPGLSSAIKALAGGGSGSSSLLGLLGKGIGGVLDYSASSKAADNAKAIADRTWGAGQQYRDNASRAMTPGFDLNSIPGYSGALSTGMDAFNRSLSAKNGNPWGQGGAAGEAISWAGKTIGLPAWQNYFNSNSNAGGLSNLAANSTQAGLNAGAADGAVYGSLGQTARNIFDPQPNYQKQYLDLLGKQYGLS